MSFRSHCKSTLFQIIIFALTLSLGLLPVASATSAATETAVAPVSKSEAELDTIVLNSDEKKQDLTGEKEESDTDESESSEEGMSTTTKVAIGVGAAVIVGAALALGGGGGGGSNSSDALLPPTVNRLTATWSASASSLEQTSYTGTYTLYSDATHSYDLQLSDGSRLTGRGRWEINAYQLTLHNNTGSNYVGEFAPGNYRTIRLTTNGGWTLDLTKM